MTIEWHDVDKETPPLGLPVLVYGDKHDSGKGMAVDWLEEEIHETWEFIDSKTKKLVEHKTTNWVKFDIAPDFWALLPEVPK